MELDLLTRVFRRLLSHQTCSKLRYHVSVRQAIPNAPQRRWYRSPQQDNSPDDFDARRESDWQQRTDFFPPNKMKDYEKYPMVTSDQLRSRRERPKRVRMLARDFIDGMSRYLYRASVTDEIIQIVSITQIMVTSPKMSLSSHPDPLSSSTRCLTKRLFVPT